MNVYIFVSVVCVPRAFLWLFFFYSFCGEDLGGVRGGKTMIRKYCVKKSIFNTKIEETL